ncbi:MAG: hypothetical protein Q9222_005962 [Ikaeria aurantiellina]
MAPTPFQVKAVYEYSSPHDDDLNFPIGQIITVGEEEGDDWFYGEYTDEQGNKKEGLFPRNFVKNYEPETPPRPARPNRTKKEADNPSATDPSEAKEQTATASVPLPKNEPMTVPDQPSEPVPTPVESASTPSSTAHQSVAPAKPSIPTSSKPAAPPVSDSVEKSYSGSFRDRINAFNKPTAPPVAPTKPSGLGSSSGSGFVKKAFVAPPPSKNAYVPMPREPPPQKVYHREEELEAEAQIQAPSEPEQMAPPTQQSTSTVTDENDGNNRPKPTSLKDRIALLQKQQMEQAARQADAAQKKEKPKRPPKKRIESQERITNVENYGEDEYNESADRGEGTVKRSMDVPRIPTEPRSRSITRPPESPGASPTEGASRPLRRPTDDGDGDIMSSVAANDEALDVSTSNDIASTDTHISREINDKKAQEQIDSDEDEGAEEEEEEVDPEVKKRMEIRERMAKMSGGMGMAGMFGPPGGMAPMPPKRQVPSSSERQSSGNERKGTGDTTSSQAPPVPIMPMPGLTKVRSPEQDAIPPAEVAKEDEDVPKSIVQGRLPEDMPDVEDLKPSSRRSTDRPLPPPSGLYRHRQIGLRLPSVQYLLRHRMAISSGQPGASNQILSPSEGSESDDEMSANPRNLSLRAHTSDDSRPTSREGPPPLPPVSTSNGPPPSLPSRPRGPPAEDSSETSPVDAVSKEASPTSPITPSTFAKRSSRPPPIPGSSPAMPPPNPQNRAPPPPPPSNAPPSRVGTSELRAPPPIPKNTSIQDSEEEVTEYEGDYDTDIGSGVSHKTALKPHPKEPTKGLNVDLGNKSDDLHHGGLPSIEPTSGPPEAVPSRAVPPVPPTQAPKSLRQSSDMPRGVPPPPPPPKEQTSSDYNEYAELYDQSASSQQVATSMDRSSRDLSRPSRRDDQSDTYTSSPPQRQVPTSPPMPSSQYASPPSLSAPSRSNTRQSLDVQRTSTSGRRSMEAPRLSNEQGFIAGDIDLGHGSQWWTQPDMPPPGLQNRRDLIYEVEDSTTSKRGGRQAVTRNVYVLYMDYSQTIIAAHFEAREPSEASLEQHHEPPPPRLRQDQLEDAHVRFGSRIAEGANSKKEAIVGDGTPHTLALDLIASLSDALRPVGVRSYGALVYANLANASVQQFDEIRSGDIVTFRNARFQGHRGAMHAKYSVDIGKPDHVAIVVDWDGTKKKVRAWEQGRESRKVRMESFKLGDMRSGEVKVWRVMARQWVGWE